MANFSELKDRFTRGGSHARRVQREEERKKTAVTQEEKDASIFSEWARHPAGTELRRRLQGMIRESRLKEDEKISSHADLACQKGYTRALEDIAGQFEMWAGDNLTASGPREA